MKRLSIGLFSICLALSLVACGGKPADMDQRIYDYGVQAVQVVESYQNGGLSDWESYERLKDIHDSISEVKTVPKDATADTNDFLVSHSVLMLECDFLLDVDDPEWKSQLQDDLGDLRESLGM